MSEPSNGNGIAGLTPGERLVRVERDVAILRMVVFGAIKITLVTLLVTVLALVIKQVASR